MARDLHDTLAQGLVSLNMRLDAIHVHLAKDNTERAKEIVQQSMNRVKSTLADARSAIDDLRKEIRRNRFFKRKNYLINGSFSRVDRHGLLFRLQIRPSAGRSNS